MKKISLPLQIAISMIAGIIFALILIVFKWDTSFVRTYIGPIGLIFINSLKALAIPLVFTGIIQGVSSTNGNQEFSIIGLRVTLLYVLTTLLAVCIGLAIAGFIQPGKKFSPSIKSDLAKQYEVYQHTKTALAPSDEVIAKAEIIPDNLLKAFSDNQNLLLLVLFAILLAMALFNIKGGQRKLILDFLGAVNQLFGEVVKLIMYLAPLGIFSLTCSILVEQAAERGIANVYDFLVGIMWYTGTVVASLAFMTFVIYPFLVFLFNRFSYLKFIKGIYKAQMIAFSTSSSLIALPASIECAEKNLGVSKKISHFVLSLGATINMDGTVLYQAIATSFIAQAYGLTFTLEKIVTILGYLTISSFGLGGIPGISIGTTSILLHTLGIPPEGIVLIVMPDRFLDMLRTVTNITGDLFVVFTTDRLEKRKAKKDMETRQ
ncbi:MAG: dicarboxylate/amino acid:cation symporter [Bacteroidota bacterium]